MDDATWYAAATPPVLSTEAATPGYCSCPGCIDSDHIDVHTNAQELSTLDPVFITRTDVHYLNNTLASWRLHLLNIEQVLESDHISGNCLSADIRSLIVSALEPIRSLTASREPCEDECGKDSTFRHEGLVLDERLFKIVQKTSRRLSDCAMPNEELQLFADCYRQFLYAHESDVRRDRLVWLSQALWRVCGGANSVHLTAQGVHVLRQAGKLCLGVGLAEEAIDYLSSSLKGLQTLRSVDKVTASFEREMMGDLLDDLTAAHIMRYEFDKALEFASRALRSLETLETDDELYHLNLSGLLAVLCGDEHARGHVERFLQKGERVWSLVTRERYRSLCEFLLENVPTFRKMFRLLMTMKSTDVHSASCLQNFLVNGTLPMVAQISSEFSDELQIKLYQEYMLLLNSNELPLQVWKTLEVYHLALPLLRVKLAYMFHLLKTTASSLVTQHLAIHPDSPVKDVAFCLHKSLVIVQNSTADFPTLQFVEAAILYALAGWTMGESSEVAEGYAQQALLLQVGLCPSGHPAICSSLQLLAEIADWRGEREDARRFIGRIRDSSEYSEIWTSRSHLDWC